MKKRISRVLNFFAFNLLFFALYLNFIHKDNSNDLPLQKNATATVKGTVLVADPAEYMKNETSFPKQAEILQN